MLASIIKQKNAVLKAEPDTLNRTYSTDSLSSRQGADNSTLTTNADYKSTQLHCKTGNREEKVCLVSGGGMHG